MEFAQFILQHEGEDVARLALSRERLASEVEDFDLALHTLECRARLRTKLPEWYARPALRYPRRLSAEQCSSSETARYKAAVALAGTRGMTKRGLNAIVHVPEDTGIDKKRENCHPASTFRVADLTGGLGVDSWAFSQVADQVLYNEMQPELAAAARFNFRELGARNILVKNRELRPGNTKKVLDGFQPDLIYLDPARRAADGRKVFRLEDCTPDVKALLPELLEASPLLLLKLSPMADIDLLYKQLPHVKELHVVAAEKECKELLLLLERDWEGPVRVTLYESGFTLKAPEAVPAVYAPAAEPGQWLFEPGKALLKAGLFTLPCRYGLQKLAPHTHLYTAREPEETLRPFGKWFLVKELVPFDKRGFRETGKRYPRAEVTARDVPMRSEELRSRMGCQSGGRVHIFGARTLEGPVLMVTETEN